MQNSDASESESDDDLNQNDKESVISEAHDDKLVMEAKQALLGILEPKESVRQALKRLKPLQT